jgi:adenine-specific DNA-methyltransferase
LSASANAERRRLRATPHAVPYRLFSITFAGAFFGLRQSAEIDSLRFAFDQLLADAAIDAEVHRWLCLALCKAIARSSTSTGHFAQHLILKPNNKVRYFNQRRRSIWREWLSAVHGLCPIGSIAWREKNQAFNGDALDLLQAIGVEKTKPRVIYADPPYTNDQYSRYYHIFETLLYYDYPNAS